MPSSRMTAEPPRKRSRLDVGSSFSGGRDVTQRLANRNHDELVQTLTSLRNQFTVRYDEYTISPEDERLVLAKSWLEEAPGARELFEIWDESTQASVACLAISVLASLLTLLNSQYTYHALGYPIVRTLLSPQYTQWLNKYLVGGHSESVLVSLKLWNALSMFAGGKEKKAVLEAFAWESKSLPKLLNMRRKGKDAVGKDGLSRPDIRTLYILYIFSFVDHTSSSSVKSAFLERHRNVFQSTFKGLPQDSYAVVRKTLELCWAGIFSDSKLKRTLKITLFNEITLSHLLKLYERNTPEGPEQDQIPADLVHHFLLAICTRPGVGVCFKDRGWYHREVEHEDAEDREAAGNSHRGSKIYNKILLNILRMLKINEDSRQQELALKILASCPELVAVYWPAAALTLEPRLSSKWIANISFFGSVISLPAPVASFHLPDSSLYQPSPPPLNSVLENILPSVSVKTHLTKGLQSPSALVQHCAALALVKCLRKYDGVVTVLRQVEEALQENEVDGQWARRRMEVEREVRRRVPDFQVIVAFSQQKGHTETAKKVEALPDPAKTALLAESAQRLLWLYYRCLPALVAETRFDVGKLLQHFAPASEGQEKESEGSVRTPGLYTLQQLHILRLLNETEQFSWTNKLDSSRSYLYALLKTYVRSDVASVHRMIERLLRNILSQSILFQDNPDEVYLWLAALPTARRKPGTEAPDGALLMDEGESVILFLDDCVQRCMKVPYKYLEEVDNLLSSSRSDSGEHAQVVSPLVAAVLEQLSAKMDARLLTASDVLAIATFTRKLCFNLAAVSEDSKLLFPVAERVDALLTTDHLESFELFVMQNAIRREVSILLTSLRRLRGVGLEIHTSAEGDPIVQDFLNQVQALPVPSSETLCQGAAYELVDWLRLLEERLLPEDVALLVAGIKRLYPPALSDLFQFMHPDQGALSSGLSLRTWLPDVMSHSTFEWVLIQCTDEQMANLSVQATLIDIARPDTFLNMKSILCSLLQRACSTSEYSIVSSACLNVAARCIENGRRLIPKNDLDAIKRYLFQTSNNFRVLCQSVLLTEQAQDALHRVLNALLDPKEGSDRDLAADIAEYWYHELQNSPRLENAPFASPWIQYMRDESLLVTLDEVLELTRHETLWGNLCDFLASVLDALTIRILSSDVNVALRHRLARILPLRSQSLGDTVDRVVSALTRASLPLGYSGILIASDHDNSEDWVFSTTVCDAQFACRREQLGDDISLETIITPFKRSGSEISAIRNLVYQARSARLELLPNLSRTISALDFTSGGLDLLDALFDSIACHGERPSEMSGALWSTIVTQLLEHASKNVPDVVHGRIIFNMLEILPQYQPLLLESVEKHISSIPMSSIPDYVIALPIVETAPTPVVSLVDQAMRWTVEFCSGDEVHSYRIEATFKKLTLLMRHTANVKPHLADPLIMAAIKHKLDSPCVLNFLRELVKVVHLKPVAVNRYLQSILQHSHFFRLCSSASQGEQRPHREAIIHLMHAFFHLHPNNTCQPSHIEPLVRVYSGTLSITDQRLSQIFRLFEKIRQASVASLLSRWSASHDALSKDALEGIQSLDGNHMFRTCLFLPEHTTYQDLQARQELYDPLFINLLFSRVLLDARPTGALAWVQLFRTNVVSLIIRNLSSRDGALRRTSLGLIAALHECLLLADLQEKAYVIYLLNLVRGIKLISANGEVVRIPCYTSLILAHALRAIFYPSNFIYPHTARFLLQRPTLDTRDVPMLYSMLYSSSDEWKKERLWITKFLADGLQSSQDWRVLRRRHTWDLLASLFQSSDKDRALRNSILEVLMNATCIPESATTLVIKSAILPWINMQISRETREEEVLALVKILENLHVRVDQNKADSSTKGAWRSTLCGCLTSILERTAFSTSVFMLLVPIVLRLSTSSEGITVTGLSLLLDKAYSWLLQLEASVEIRQSWKYPVSSRPLPPPPHRAQAYHIADDRDPILVWGESIESLWRVSMTLTDKSSSWDGLTSRLLVWRALVGPEVSLVGEWARREVVRNLSA